MRNLYKLILGQSTDMSTMCRVAFCQRKIQLFQHSLSCDESSPDILPVGSVLGVIILRRGQFFKFRYLSLRIVQFFRNLIRFLLWYPCFVVRHLTLFLNRIGDVLSTCSKSESGYCGEVEAAVEVAGRIF